MINQEVIYNVTGQSFFYDPLEGRPSAPTLTVYRALNDDDAGGVVAAGACTVDSVNTTFSAAAGATQITVASGTGITRGNRYLVTGTNGDREWAEVLGISGTIVNLRQPLKNTYAASSTFQGCRISAAVDSSWVANKSNITDILDPDDRLWITGRADVAWVPGAAGYRLRWSYTANSSPTIGISFADLVRYPAKSLLTPLDVDRRFPGWIDRLPTDYQEDQGQSLVDEAFQAMKLDALGDDLVVRRIRQTEVLRELVIYRANLLAVEAQVAAGAPSGDALKAARDLYQSRFDRLMRETKVPVDRTGQGSSAEPERTTAWRR